MHGVIHDEYARGLAGGPAPWHPLRGHGGRFLGVGCGNHGPCPSGLDRTKHRPCVQSIARCKARRMPPSALRCGAPGLSVWDRRDPLNTCTGAGFGSSQVGVGSTRDARDIKLAPRPAGASSADRMTELKTMRDKGLSPRTNTRRNAARFWTTCRRVRRPPPRHPPHRPRLPPDGAPRARASATCTFRAARSCHADAAACSR